MTELHIMVAGRSAKNKWSVIAKAEGAETVVDVVRLGERKARADFTNHLIERMPGIDREIVEAKLESLAEEVLVVANDGPCGATEEEVAKSAYLVGLAMDAFEFVVSNEGQCYAIPKEAPHIATALSPENDALGGWLRWKCWASKQDVVSSSTIQNAVDLVETFAREQPKQRVHRRVARHEGAVIVDLADDQGRCVVVDANGWRVENRAPVVFSRTQLRGPLPVPMKGGRLEQLDELVNFGPENRDLAVGWLLASMLPGVTTPIGLLGGQQGTGKTTAARFMCQLVDPNPAPVRSSPKDIENWCVTAQASWVIVLDNISTIPDWFSDTLCKAATGEAMVRRKLYSNSSVSVFTVHNPVLLTSIDPGELRGDLLDRICYFDLEPIASDARRRDAELAETFERLRAKILGALLDLLVEVLRVHARVQVEDLPRMADFGHLLACIDTVRGTRTLQTFGEQRVRAARDAVESSVVGQLLVPWIEDSDGRAWSGTATQLLALLKSRANGPIEGIRTARKLAGELRRLIPSLQAIGIELLPPTDLSRKSGGNRERCYRIRRLAKNTVPTVPIVPSGDPRDGRDGRDDVRSTSDSVAGSRVDRAPWSETDAEVQS